MVRIVEMRCGKWWTRNSFETMPRAGLLTREGFCKGVFFGVWRAARGGFAALAPAARRVGGGFWRAGGGGSIGLGSTD